MRIQTKCKYCGKYYEVETHHTKYLECCSDECIKKFYEATGSGINLGVEHIFYEGDIPVKRLVQNYRKKHGEV